MLLLQHFLGGIATAECAESAGSQCTGLFGCHSCLRNRFELIIQQCRIIFDDLTNRRYEYDDNKAANDYSSKHIYSQFDRALRLEGVFLAIKNYDNKNDDKQQSTRTKQMNLQFLLFYSVSLSLFLA